MTEPLNLDYNAGAPLDARVAAAMASLPAAADGNPSSGHAIGRRARSLLEEARERIAAALGRAPEEIVFTSGGTEANQLAVHGVFRALRLDERGELWISPLEHPSVRAPLEALAPRAHRVVRLDCAPRGRVRIPSGCEQPPPFVSLCAACGESGILQDVAGMAERVHASGGLVHSDASQLLGRVPFAHVGAADYVTLSPHKLGGPRGIAVLVQAPGRPLAPIWLGGGQERGLRPGTEAVRLAHGAAVAIALAVDEQEQRAQRMRGALDALLDALDAEGIDVLARAAPARLPNTATIVFDGCDARLLMPALDALGVCVSFGTACRSGAREVSPALRALGLTEREAKCALRVSVGPDFSPKSIDAAAAAFHQALGRVRAISP